jgi:hypothetical protein
MTTAVDMAITNAKYTASMCLYSTSILHVYTCYSSSRTAYALDLSVAFA